MFVVKVATRADRRVVPADLPGLGACQTDKDAKQAGLAYAVLAANMHPFAGVDDQIYIRKKTTFTANAAQTTRTKH